MDQQPEDSARETQHNVLDRNASVDPLLEGSKVESIAFGILIVAYACIMSVAPLIAKYPDEFNQLLRILLECACDWRLWVGISTTGILSAIAIIAFKRRNRLPSGT